jgi:hypothetical protein
VGKAGERYRCIHDSILYAGLLETV